MKEKKEILTETETETTGTGKFKSAEELLSAYNALEREFTKRCQLVSKLQASLASREGSQAENPDGAQAAAKSETADESAEADGQINDMLTSEKSADAQSEIESLTEKRDAARIRDDIKSFAAIHAEELSAIPEVMDFCIERYKRKIIAAGSVPSPEGMAVIVPARRPKTLADAKRLADSMLDKF